MTYAEYVTDLHTKWNLHQRPPFCEECLQPSDQCFCCRDYPHYPLPETESPAHARKEFFGRLAHAQKCFHESRTPRTTLYWFNQIHTLWDLLEDTKLLIFDKEIHIPGFPQQ